MNKYKIHTPEWTEPDIIKIVTSFNTDDRNTFQKRYNYYIGKQKILNKKPLDVGRPNNKVVTNFVRNIVDSYEGYSVGNPVRYSSDTEITEIEDVLNYNDYQDEDAELYRQALIFGRGVEICYIDEDAQIRFKTLDPRGCIPVYDDTLNENLLCAIRFWNCKYKDKLNEDEYFVEVYDDTYVTKYKSTPGWTSLSLVEQYEHHFNQCPITFFELNKEEEGIADQIFSLQDAYNNLLSDSLDDWDSFCQAYLVLKGMVADKEELAAMKENRALMIDTDGAVEYLTKDVSTQEIENLLKTTEDKIREIAQCPNFNDPETFGNTQSGVAMSFRLLGMRNRVSGILNNFKKALQRRIELICSILYITAGLDGESNLEVWRDIEIHFTENLPNSLVPSTVQDLMLYQGLVSQETLLGLVPFIKDANEELKLVNKEREESLELYSFDMDSEGNEE